MVRRYVHDVKGPCRINPGVGPTSNKLERKAQSQERDLDAQFCDERLRALRMMMRQAYPHRFVPLPLWVRVRVQFL